MAMSRLRLSRLNRIPTPVVFDWTGLYVGANGGGEWGRLHGNDADTDSGIPGQLTQTFVFGLDPMSSQLAVGLAARKLDLTIRSGTLY